jgi:hypothetical protein
MWFTATGSCVNLSIKEKNILADLAACLFSMGWKVRTGGRGVVDDIFYDAAGINNVVSETIIPVDNFRKYNSNTDRDIFSYEGFCEPIKIAAQGMSAYPPHRIVSNLQRNIIASSSSMLFGVNLDRPSRFVVTFCKSPSVSTSAMSANDDEAMLHTEEAPLFFLAKKRQIPVFNLANKEHMNRVVRFLEQARLNIAEI